jgi:hypothetical protein
MPAERYVTSYLSGAPRMGDKGSAGVSAPRLVEQRLGAGAAADLRAGTRRGSSQVETAPHRVLLRCRFFPAPRAPGAPIVVRVEFH